MKENTIFWIAVILVIGVSWLIGLDYLKYDPTYEVQPQEEIIELPKQIMPITYSFNIVEKGNKKIICSDAKKDKIRFAFFRIENRTNYIVNFKEVENESDIEIDCRGMETSDYDGATYNQDLGIATMGILGEKVEGNITFFYSRQDREPYCTQTELHEIFHVFGFEHIEEGFTIMSPIKSVCKFSIDDYIVEDLLYYYG